ncbi:hypothetical protein MDA_GLEAN10009254 [Myotis davidii]|uniref:Uncharacterized protein n=1 Tax=Myotis davidii TaxID=225400 RepID=L5LG94_MYODS|nr:hypothetical protein MDA_GLEAN10009254 [Myotis davidii]
MRVWVSWPSPGERKRLRPVLGVSTIFLPLPASSLSSHPGPQLHAHPERPCHPPSIPPPPPPAFAPSSSSHCGHCEAMDKLTEAPDRRQEEAVPLPNPDSEQS